MADLSAAAIEEIARIVRAGMVSEQVTVSPSQVDEGERLFVTHPSDLTLVDVTESAMKGLRNPLFRKGTVTLTALDSLVDFTNRMKMLQTALFADAEKHTLLTVFDYHDPINVPDAPEDAEPKLAISFPSPQWGRYRAFFAFPQSRQYKAWRGANKKAMTQSDLASFIEDNVVDVMSPASLADDKTAALVHQLGLKLAGPETLLSVARGLSIKAEEQIAQVVNLSTGETQIQYTQTHTKDESAVDIKVPTGFIIALPIFEGDAAYQLLVRLKYRKAQQSIHWHFDIYNIDRAFDDAFEQSCDRVRVATSLPLFYGSPES